ncbi:hypothetical protein HK096_001045 [Nowakowskiella sp. JEL0078]|nr:hypothetical protein HK096_001045 [Nowakowskiella sp. JEL0078]
MVCVAAYFVLSTLMWAYSQYVEKNVLYTGVLKSQLDPDLIATATSKMEKFSDKYTLELSVSRVGSKTSKAKVYTKTLTKSIGKWFDVDGRFAAKEFKDDLVSLLGKDFFKEK